MSNSSSSTLRNGLKVLDILKNSSGLRLTTIAQKLALNKSTAFRLLNTLVELNYVKKIDNHYSLVHQSQANFLNWPTIPVPRDLTDNFQTTGFVGILRDKNVIITQVLPVTSGFDEFDVLGNVTPVNLSALGKAVVAYLPELKQKQILQQLTYTTGTKYTLNDQLTFQKNLQIIRQKGYALDDEESTLGIRCLAVPIFQNNIAIAALGISGNFQKIPRGKIQLMAKELCTYSQQITNNFF